MSGGIWDKLGNEYERAYVCHLWMRVLEGSIDSVTWEHETADAEGSEGFFEAGGNLVRFQCKTRTSGQWASADLVKILVPPAQQADAGDPQARFWFVTTMGSGPLAQLIEWARSGCDVDELESNKKDARALLRKLDSRLGRTSPSTKTVAFARNIELVIRDQGTLSELVELQAQILAPDNPRRLIDALRGLPFDSVRGQRVDRQCLVEWLPETLRLSQGPRIDEVQRRLALLRKDFVEIASDRRVLTAIDRPEATQIRSASLASTGGRTVVVHGPAGSGKSDVLARLVEEWRDADGLLVPIIATDHQTIDELPTIRDLRVAAGSGRAVLLIDQLDQCAQSSGATGRFIAPLRRWIDEARLQGWTVILGCRTVDVRHETRLHRIIAPKQGESVEVAVGDLPEAGVLDALGRNGMTLDELPLSLRSVVMQPLGLGIVAELTSEKDWRGARTIHDLTANWLSHATRNQPELLDALDGFLEQLEREGRARLDTASCKLRPDQVADLVDSGILTTDGDHFVRPRHQAIADTRLAAEYGRARDAEELLQHVGPKERQSPREAIRLRRAVTILAHRAGDGPAILDEVFRSSRVRPLLRHALLVGLAEERSSPSKDLDRVVATWLDDQDETGLVSGTLLWARGAWVEAQADWIDRQWNSGETTAQDYALRLLASVSVQHGDFVAQRLEDWDDGSRSVLERADMALWHDPSEDSDELFEMRLRVPRAARRGTGYAWSRLAEANPERTARWLVHFLRQADTETLVGHRRTDDAFWGLKELLRYTSEVAEYGPDQLRRWWHSLEIDDLQSISTGDDDSADATLVTVVRLLAGCFSHQISRGERSWCGVLEYVPDLLRDLDRWLLLEVGANLSDGPSRSADDAIAWMTSEPGIQHVRVGFCSHPLAHELLAAFVGGVSHAASDDALRTLEQWILDQRDRWTAVDEDLRMAWLKAGDGWPTRVGALAYHLLPELPEDRLDLRTRNRLGELRRKFDAVAERMFAPPVGRLAPVSSSVPEFVLARWSPEEWRENLERAPERDFGRKKDGRILCGDRETLCRELVGVAAANPFGTLPVFEELLSIRHVLPTWALPWTLEGLCRVDSPAGTDADAWDSLPDERVLALVSRPEVLKLSGLSTELGRVVSGRPAAQWPESVVERLIEIALESGDTAGAHATEQQYETTRINDAQCLALEALTAIAAHQPVWHSRLLEVAHALAPEGPSVSRAGAGRLAFWCRDIDRAKAEAIILDACEDAEAAASWALSKQLLWCARLDDSPSTRTRAISLVMGLCRSAVPWVRTKGGMIALRLWTEGLVGSDELDPALACFSESRQGAAQQLAQCLAEASPSDELIERALNFLNDIDEEVGDLMLRRWLSGSARRLLQEHQLATKVLDTEAARRNVHDLIEALDKEGALSNASDSVVRMARALASANSTHVPSHFDVPTLMATLARLVEVQENVGDTERRNEALDAWDDLIERYPNHAVRLIRNAVQ